ncbi:hypothetical protein D0437_27630 [Bacillus cereus]|uniref:Uncharacterized protein n=1 Tax=Bacillus cereus TaxID=1396 RepID=A0A9X7QMP8_BACCE|nr:hypothetical protein D0437_27630 [Bacillus cereus]
MMVTPKVDPNMLLLLGILVVLVYSLICLVKREWIRGVLFLGLAGLIYYLTPGFSGDITEMIGKIGEPIVSGGER